MQAFGDAGLADQEVVAAPAVGALGHIGRVGRQHHVFTQGHGFVKTHQRALHHVVTLAVAVQAFFLRPAVLAHVLVVGLPDVLAGRAGFEQAGGELLRLDYKVELVLHFL